MKLLSEFRYAQAQIRLSISKSAAICEITLVVNARQTFLRLKAS